MGIHFQTQRWPNNERSLSVRRMPCHCCASTNLLITDKVVIQGLRVWYAQCITMCLKGNAVWPSKAAAPTVASEQDKDLSSFMVPTLNWEDFAK